MSNPPAVDVLILSWNRVEDTIAAIQSAHEQEGIQKRIIVVDQGSDSQNLARLRHFLDDIPEVRLETLGRNIGVAGGRNYAARLGAAPYLIALDSDAIFGDRMALYKAVTYLEDNPHLCALGFRITNFYTRENDATSWDYPEGCVPEKGFPTTRFVGAGHAIRRSTFELVGCYDERLFFCGEEVDLCYRMLNTGGRIEYFPGAEILHKISPEHRFFWGRGRYFYTVRNNIFTSYKFRTPNSRILLGTAAFALRGIRNGMPLVTFRAAFAALRLCRRFNVSHEEKRFYDLSAETKRYIAQLEPSREESVLQKILRQFRRLPNQA